MCRLDIEGAYEEQKKLLVVDVIIMCVVDLHFISKYALNQCAI
jgi:hypothetical protein